MLDELELLNLGPICHAVITPAASMTAITGETGAGKSMLLNAIRMICGAPADAARVAPGATEAWAQGIFSIHNNERVRQLAQDAGIHVDDDEVFLARSTPSQGRSRAMMCGKTVPRSLLQSVSDHLITIHGQSDQLRIASSAQQRAFLDEYAQHNDLLDHYSEVWQRIQHLETQCQQLQMQEASARQRLDYLQESIEHIAAINPREGEIEELKEQRDRVEHAAQIHVAVGQALQALDPSQVSVDDDHAGALEQLQHAIESLQSLHLGGVFEECEQRLRALRAECDDIVYTLSARVDADVQPVDLDAINARIHELDELTRRWGPTIGDVLAWKTQAEYECEDLDASPERIAQLSKALESARREALDIAQQLTKSRRKAARELSREVNTELAGLAMQGASLTISVTPRSGKDILDAHGCDDIAFMFTPYPNAKPLPMGKSASGGELSRLMLALELSAHKGGQHNGSMTFIFDEVDAGVGGVAAAQLGKRLAKLAQKAQVIVVTHLPQVASFAHKQFVVQKQADSDNAATSTTVHLVEGHEREEEIARMLSGSDTASSLDHARELLAQSVLEK